MYPNAASSSRTSRTTRFSSSRSTAERLASPRTQSSGRFGLGPFVHPLDRRRVLRVDRLALDLHRRGQLAVRLAQLGGEDLEALDRLVLRELRVHGLLD